MRKNKATSFDEISELIVNAIIEEPVFSREILIPRIRAILRAFNLKYSSVPNIEKEEKASVVQRRLLHMEKQEREIRFWKKKCIEHLPDMINDFYKEIDDILEKKN